MVSMRDRALIEARAKGIDVEESLRHPWRQMLHLDIVGSAFAISVFLIIYYTAVGFFTVYFTSLFGFSLAQANGIGNWFWAFDAGALIVVGIVSDWVKVRKPFMVLGAVGAIVMTIIFASLAGHPHTSYYTFAGVISGLAVFLAIAYAPWMASFTETAERRNPALVATALAIWGWIIRTVIALSILILPTVVSSMTPLVTYGPSVAALSTQYAPELATLKAISPSTLAALTANPANAAAAAAAVGEIVKAEGVSPAAATAKLTALATVPKADLAYLNAHGAQVDRRRRGRARGVEELVVGVRRRRGGLHPAHLPHGRPVGPAPGAPGRRGARAQRASRSWKSCTHDAGGRHVRRCRCRATRRSARSCATWPTCSFL